ncbi:MAG: preprotein translocase subunit SecE [Pseudomonadota bacterium]
MQRNKKTISLIYLGCGVLVWLLLREMFASIFVWLEIGFGADWLVPIYDVIGVFGGLVVFIVFILNQKINDFVNEVLSELGKVVWPNRKETVLSTGVVSVLVGICSIILLGYDALWGFMVKVFYQ